MARALRVLVVEDEMTIALMIEDMLEDMGHRVTALAMRLGPALEAAKTAEIDFALLDINLDGQVSFPVAEILMERGVPFAFASGYGSKGLDPAFRKHPMIRKPFDQQTLKQVIESEAA